MNNKLLVVSGDGWSITPSPEAHKEKLFLLETSAKINTAPTDKPSEIIATTARKGLKSFLNNLEAQRKAVKQPLLDVGRQIDDMARNLAFEVVQEDNRLLALLSEYQIKLDHERKKLEAEAQRKREEADKMAREAELARQKAEEKHTVQAEVKADRMELKAVESRVEVMALEQRADESRVRGGGMAWCPEVYDIHQLYKYHPNMVTITEKKRELIEWAKLTEQNGKEVVLPGVRFYKKPFVKSY